MTLQVAPCEAQVFQNVVFIDYKRQSLIVLHVRRDGSKEVFECISVRTDVLHLIDNRRIICCIVQTPTDKHEYQCEHHIETTCNVIVVKKNAT